MAISYSLQQKIKNQLCGMLILVRELEPMVSLSLSHSSVDDELIPGFHKGAVWDLDPSWDSQYLVTACADGSARLYETCTGKYICRMPHRG